MRGRLIGTLFLPYLLVSILGQMSEDQFSSSVATGELMVNEIYDARLSEADAAGTASYTGGNTVNKLTTGFTFLTDATGTILGFTKNLFKIITLNYSWWSGCKKSTDVDPGYNSAGNLLTAGTGNCYIDSQGVQYKDAPMGYVFVRYLLLIMALPGIYVLSYKSAELMARFVSSIGSSIGGLASFIPGLR